MAEQWQVQYFLMKEKIKQLKGQQRVMEVRALLNELRYHPLLRSAGATLRTESREYNPNQPRDSRGRWKGVGNVSLTEIEKYAIIRNKDEIIKAFQKTNFNGMIHIPPEKIDVDSLGYDDEHITKREHKVTRETVKEYIDNALISYTKEVKDGIYENYLGRNGAVYINKTNNTIRTAFASSEYNPGSKRMLQTIDSIITVKEDAE